MDQNKHFSFKTCLLGDGAVGKTSLVRKFVLDEFEDKYITTIGTKVSKKELILNHPTDANLQNIKVTLTIWDIVGQPGLHTLRSMYYTGADGALVVGDLTRKDTFDNIANWVASIFGKTGRIPLILLANKNDLKDQHQVEPNDVDNYAKTIEAKHLFTSAKTGNNVETAFSLLAEQMVTNSLTRKVMQPIEILDSMVADFCTLYGSLKEGMNPFREVCEEVQLNFQNPKISELIKLNEHLRERLRKRLNDAKAKSFYKKNTELIQQLQS